MSEPSYKDTLESYFTFVPANQPEEPVLLLDKTGFTYKGVKIEDAGMAYDVWMKVMGLMMTPREEALTLENEQLKAELERLTDI